MVLKMLRCPLHFVDINIFVNDSHSSIFVNFIKDWIANNIKDWHDVDIHIGDRILNHDTQIKLCGGFVNKNEADKFKIKFNPDTTNKLLHIVTIEESNYPSTQVDITKKYLEYWLSKNCSSPYYMGDWIIRRISYVCSHHISVPIGFTSEDAAILFKLSWW